MADPTTADQVRSTIADQLALDNQPLDDATIASLKADSLDALEIVMALEERFHIAITDDEAAEACTVAQCIALVSRKLAAPAETEVL